MSSTSFVGAELRGGRCGYPSKVARRALCQPTSLTADQLDRELHTMNIPALDATTAFTGDMSQKHNENLTSPLLKKEMIDAKEKASTILGQYATSGPLLNARSILDGRDGKVYERPAAAAHGIYARCNSDKVSDACKKQISCALRDAFVWEFIYYSEPGTATDDAVIAALTIEPDIKEQSQILHSFYMKCRYLAALGAQLQKFACIRSKNQRGNRRNKKTSVIPPAGAPDTETDCEESLRLLSNDPAEQNYSDDANKLLLDSVSVGCTPSSVDASGIPVALGNLHMWTVLHPPGLGPVSCLSDSCDPQEHLASLTSAHACDAELEDARATRARSSARKAESSGTSYNGLPMAETNQPRAGGATAVEPASDRPDSTPCEPSSFDKSFRLV